MHYLNTRRVSAFTSTLLALTLGACHSSPGGGNDDGGGGGNADLSTSGGNTDLDPPGGPVLKTVFMILLENHSWSTIKGNASAPYINGLLNSGAHAENYKTPPGNHPSEPNYIWLEAGSNLGITTDDPPAKNHQSTTDHLVTQLAQKGVTWKAYQESIDGTTCPLADSGDYATKHCPMLFFDDINGNLVSNYQPCIDHVRPVTELPGDLTNNKVAQYNFITPNLCNDMHGELTAGPSCNVLNGSQLIQNADNWLKDLVPKIMASSAYQNGGVIFILWDEGDESLTKPASDGPIGFIALSNYAKQGHASTIAYTHSSTLRTVETIFGVPFLRDAQNATDLSDLFTQFP